MATRVNYGPNGIYPGNPGFLERYIDRISGDLMIWYDDLQEYLPGEITEDMVLPEGYVLKPKPPGPQPIPGIGAVYQPPPEPLSFPPPTAMPMADDGLGGLPQPQPASAAIPAAPPDGLTPLPGYSPPPGTEPRAAQYLGDAARMLDANANDLGQMINDMVNGTGNGFAGDEALLNTMMDEMIGSADNALTDGGSQWNKVANKLVKDLNEQLVKNAGDMYGAGLEPPWHPADMAKAMDGNFLDLVAQAAPGFRSLYAPTGPISGTTAQQIAEGQIPPDQMGLAALVSGTVTAPTNPFANLEVRSGTVVPPSGTVPSYSGNVPPRVDDLYSSAVVSQTNSPPTSVGQQCCPPQPAPVVNVTLQLPPGYPGTQPVQFTIPPPPYTPPAIPGLSPIPAPPVPQAPLIPGLGLPQPTPPQPAPAPPGPPAAALLFPGTTDPKFVATLSSINWNDLRACSLAGQVVGNPGLNAVKKDQPADGTPKTPWDEYWNSKFSWSGILGMGLPMLTGPAELNNIRKAWAASDAATAATGEALANRVMTETALKLVSPQSVGQFQAAGYFGARLAGANWAERQSGFPLSYLYQSDLYLYQFANPQMLPNQIKIDQAYLTGTIDDATWVCWTRANGNLPEPARRVMIADQNRPAVSDLITLWRRGKLTKDQLYTRAREQGVLDPKYVDDWINGSIGLPTQSDLVRFMVRDAADDSVAKEYNLDKDFDLKYTGQMKEWAKALGIDDKYFRFEWRSHWRTPSYTQLTEMLARLRPDRPEVSEWQAANPGAAPGPDGKPPAGQPLSVSLDQVRKALEIDDMAPGWVEQLIAVSYNPINRTDAVRAYMIGAFTEERLYHAFRDVRYSERDARTLVDFYRQQKNIRQRNLTGVWSTRKIVRYYKTGTITRAQAADLLRPLQPNTTQVEEVLRGADLELAADLTNVRLRGLRRGFMYGEVDEQGAVRLMRGWGMDTGAVERVMAQWIIERDSRYKMPTVAMISGWIRKGIIDVEEARTRLGNLGYKPNDVDRIIAGALKWDFSDDPPTPDELHKAVSDAVKSQKDAKGKSNVQLGAIADAALKTLVRVRTEMARRLPPDQRQALPPIVIP